MKTLLDRQHLTINRYADSKLVLGHRFGIDATKRLLGRLSKSKVMISLSVLNWIIKNTEYTTREIQLGLIKQLFPDKNNKCSFLFDQNYIFFFDYQIYTLMKLASIYCDEKIIGYEEKEIDRYLQSLGLALLGTTDFISRIYSKEAKTSSKVDPNLSIYKDIVLNSYYSGRSIESLILVRSIFLFLILPKEKKSVRTSMDLEEIFLSEFGIPIEDFLFFGFAISIHYIHYKYRKDLQKFDFILFQPDIHLQNTKIEKGILNNIFSILSTNLSDLEEICANQSDREMTHDFIYFKQHPLIEVDSGKFLPVSLTFLIERISKGIYWMLLDAYYRQSPNHSNNFSSYIGELFQVYVEKILYENFERENSSEIIFEFEQLYTIGKNEYRSPDIILFSKGNLILVEVSKTQLQERKTISLGDPNEYEKDIEKIILHNASSLDKQINIFLNNHDIFGHINFSDVKNIYPVIITIEMIPRLPILRKWLNTICGKNSLFTNPIVQPLSLLCVEDVEILETFTNLFFIDVLIDWLKYTKNGFISLGDYLYKNKLTSKGKNISFLTKAWEDFSVKAQNKIFRNDSTKEVSS